MSFHEQGVSGLLTIKKPKDQDPDRMVFLAFAAYARKDVFDHWEPELDFHVPAWAKSLKPFSETFLCPDKSGAKVPEAMQWKLALSEKSVCMRQLIDVRKMKDPVNPNQSVEAPHKPEIFSHERERI